VLPDNIIIEVDLKIVGVVLRLDEQNSLFAVDLNRMVTFGIVEKPFLDDINSILFGSGGCIFYDN
jgi:hypothetical protein